MITPAGLGLDPVSIGLNVFTEVFKSIFGIGQPNAEAQAKALREMCSNPATWRGDACGPNVWFATKCPDGSIAANSGACRCPLSAVFSPGLSGCSRSQAVADNWYVFAGLALIAVLATK